MMRKTFFSSNIFCKILNYQGKSFLWTDCCLFPPTINPRAFPQVSTFAVADSNRINNAKKTKFDIIFLFFDIVQLSVNLKLKIFWEWKKTTSLQIKSSQNRL